MPILTSEERVGTLLADKYRIDRIIGKGGMGVVFAAEHTWTGRHVAVKIIHPSLAEDEILAQRLLREARTAASLNHPNAVQVLDMGADADGTVYLVLELLKGEALEARLERERKLSFPETLAILLPVMNALTVAHEAGLVHRDLKPDNIFLHDGPTGVVPTLLDFGIAKVIQDGGAKVTQTGVVMGTPHYISPEQAVGESTVGPAADVWAMGVLLFECLAGTMPFEGSTSTKIVMKVVCEDAPKLAKMGVEPIGAAHAIDRALEKDLSKRYENMGQFTEALWAAAVQAGYASVPMVGSSPNSVAPGRLPTPAGGSAAVPLYAPADGAAPKLILTPSRGVAHTTPMGAVPPVALRASQPEGSRPWGAIIGGALAALLLVGGLTVGVGFLFFSGDLVDDAPPTPSTSAPSIAATPVAPDEPQATDETSDPPAVPPVADPDDPAEVEPVATDDPVEEPVEATQEPAAVRRPARGGSDEPGRGGRSERRGNRPEISNSW